MKTLNLVKKSLMGLMMLVLLTGIWVAPAAAQEPEPQVERNYRGMEYLLRMTQLRVDAFQDQIDNSSAAADLTDEYIQEEKDDGNDTSALEAAMSDLRAKLGEAQSLRDEAAEILDEKAGFDDDGTVVDAEQARDTLKHANRTMRDAGETLRSGRHDFRKAMRDYRQDKRADRK